MRNMSVVFCFLLNRVHFLRDNNLSSMPLSHSRAALCELMAIKLLRVWAESTMELATVLTTSWGIFAGAGPEVLEKVDESYGDVDTNERVGNAIEMAIIGQAKRFIKSDAFQKVIGTRQHFSILAQTLMQNISCSRLYLVGTGSLSSRK